MYKKVKDYAQENGLTIEEKNGIIYGQMNGYFILIQQDPAVLASIRYSCGPKAAVLSRYHPLLIS